jgi:hypothetical protein
VLARPQRRETATLGRPTDGRDDSWIGTGPDAQCVEADLHAIIFSADAARGRFLGDVR